MAERRLRWGVIGTARIGRNLFVPGVKAGALGEVVAIGSRSADTARSVADELGIPTAYGSYEEVLADQDVSAVYIPLPNSLHAEWTIKAAEAGKHVLCEKPLARTAADAERMQRACASAGVVLMEAFMWRHHPQHARVQELLAGGAIGVPRLVRGSFTYPIAPDPTNVRLQAGLEGGSLMDVGCYPVNVARWAFGAEPLEVSAQQVVSPEYGVETAFAGVLRFPGDCMAAIDSSFHVAGKGEYEIHGSEGRLIVDRAYRPDERPGRITIVRGQTQRVEEVPAANQFAAEADHFARSVQAGRLLAPAEDGVAQAHVIAALYESAESGRSVSLG
jgi:D-xylose 1-dehydrogenase (NADP+, D-xylono-1,5-lactone-forming)